MLLLPYKTNPNKTKRKNATKNMSVLRGLPNTTIEPPGYSSGVQDSGRPAKPQVGGVKAKDASEKTKISKRPSKQFQISQGFKFACSRLAGKFFVPISSSA